MKLRVKSYGSMEQHFQVSLYLMLFFFFVDYAADGLFVIGLTPAKIGNSLARDSFMAFFGIAMGILRGMSGEQKPNEEPPIPNPPPTPPDPTPNTYSIDNLRS